MALFDSSAGKVFYEDTGIGKPLIFVHGRTLDSRMWLPQVEFFKDTRRCITYDLNGFGKSEVPKDNYSRVQTLRELCAHLNINSATFIGLSLGSFVLIGFALEFPELLESLVLMSPAIPGVKPTDSFMQDWKPIESAGMKGDFALAKNLWLHSPAFQTMKENNPENYKLFEEIINGYTCWDIHNPPKHVGNTQDATSLLERITVPSLIISGGKDYDLFQNNAVLLKEKLPNAKSVVLEKARHMVNLDFPKEVNSLIQDFLNT